MLEVCECFAPQHVERLRAVLSMKDPGVIF